MRGGGVHGRLEHRSAVNPPENWRFRLGVGRSSVFSAPTSAAEPIPEVTALCGMGPGLFRGRQRRRKKTEDRPNPSLERTCSQEIPVGQLVNPPSGHRRPPYSTPYSPDAPRLPSVAAAWPRLRPPCGIAGIRPPAASFAASRLRQPCPRPLCAPPPAGRGGRAGYLRHPALAPSPPRARRVRARACRDLP